MLRSHPSSARLTWYKRSDTSHSQLRRKRSNKGARSRWREPSMRRNAKEERYHCPLPCKPTQKETQRKSVRSSVMLGKAKGEGITALPLSILLFGKPVPPSRFLYSVLFNASVCSSGSALYRATDASKRGNALRIPSTLPDAVAPSSLLYVWRNSYRLGIANLIRNRRSVRSDKRY